MHYEHLTKEQKRMYHNLAQKPEAVYIICYTAYAEHT